MLFLKCILRGHDQAILKFGKDVNTYVKSVVTRKDDRPRKRQRSAGKVD